MADNDIKHIFFSQIPQISKPESLDHHSLGSFATPPSDSANSATKSDANQTGNKRKTISDVERYILIPPVNTNNDGNPFLGLKKPRGRPHGSKNKPKLPIFIRKVNEHGMHPILIQIAPGVDVIGALINFALRRHIRILILSACGSISEAAIHNTLPLNTNAIGLSMRGPFNMMSLSGIYYDSHVQPACSSFSILLGGTHGQVFGGIVARKVMVAGTIKVMAASFKRTEFYVLQLNADGGEDNVNSNENNNVVRVSTYKAGNPNIVTRQTAVTKLVPLHVGNYSGGGGNVTDDATTNVKNEIVNVKKFKDVKGSDDEKQELEDVVE
ncbi:hypothetical protein PIB30_038371 [Stylosanthes scabra]|uniref:PPC domain-containing protein n=1 Tax=Stylosanthes scabra TaxID=79078 RepID=A0ABU6QEI2_9FABA|nr:hypothetical protein [Stylosanthes scabra]